MARDATPEAASGGDRARNPGPGSGDYQGSGNVGPRHPSGAPACRQAGLVARPGDPRPAATRAGAGMSRPVGRVLSPCALRRHGRRPSI